MYVFIYTMCIHGESPKKCSTSLSACVCVCVCYLFLYMRKRRSRSKQVRTQESAPHKPRETKAPVALIKYMNELSFAAQSDLYIFRLWLTTRSKLNESDIILYAF